MNDNSLFGAKELYEVALKSTSKMEINGKIIEKGETIALFDKIQIANFNEIKSIISANGGFDNRAWVTWDTTKEIDLTFTQGVFSKTQFAILSNSRIYTKEQESISIPVHEIVESDENGIVEFTYLPDGYKPIFVYDIDGNKVSGDLYERNFTPTVTKPYTDYSLDYYQVYNDKRTYISIGKRLSNEYFTLEGKTRFKDDETGKDITGIIEIPKLKLVSGLSMILGQNASPLVPRFRAIGYPVGVRGNSEVLRITFLNDDIDSDIQ